MTSPTTATSTRCSARWRTSTGSSRAATRATSASCSTGCRTTSDRHPWFEAARSRDDPKRDWYVWRDGVKGGPPNDWVSAFEAVGPAWTFDEATGQWYLHSFMAEQPDLNWDNPEVEAAMHDVLRFWLDRGIDGFRLDAIVKIAKDPLLRSNGSAALRHHEAWSTIHERLRGIRRVVDEYPDRMIVGEVDAWDMHGLVSSCAAATSCTSRTTC